MIYKGMVHAIPNPGNGMFSEYRGIFVNVACSASLQDDFIKRVSFALEQYQLTLVDIEEIEVISEYSVSNYTEKSMRDAIMAASTSDEVQFDTFYTYDGYGE